MAMFPHQSQEAQDASARVAEKAYNALTGNEKKALLDQAAKVIDSLHREREAGLKDGTWPNMDDGTPLAINDDPVAHAKNALMHNGYTYQRALDDLTERRSDAPAAAVPVQAAIENSNPAITPDKVEALTAAISHMKDASGEPKFSPERAAQLSAGIAEYYNEYVQQHGNAASSRRAAGVVIDGALQTPEALGHLVGGQQRREIHAHVIIPNHPASQSPAPAHNNHMIDAAMTDKLASGIQSLGYSEADAHKLAGGLADNYNRETDPAKIHIHQNAIRIALGEPDPNTGLAVDENVRRDALTRMVKRQEGREEHEAHVVGNRPYTLQTHLESSGALLTSAEQWLKDNPAPPMPRPHDKAHAEVASHPASVSASSGETALLETHITQKHSVISERTQTKAAAREVEDIAHRLGIDSTIVNNDGVLTKAEIQAIQEKSGATLEKNKGADGKLDGIIGPDTLAHIKQAMASHNVSVKEVPGVSTPTTATSAARSVSASPDMA